MDAANHSLPKVGMDQLERAYEQSAERESAKQNLTDSFKSAADSAFRSAADNFSGLTGGWKQWGTLGVIGVLSGLSVYYAVWGLPRMQQDFHGLIDAERKASREERAIDRAEFREDRKASIEHGNKSVKDITDAINAQTKEVTNKQQELIDTLRRAPLVQGKN